MHRGKRLFVISDLHIGGRYGAHDSRDDRGFRMCRSVAALTAFVQSVADRPLHADEDVELVINGDFVDFLAEEWTEPERWRPFVAEVALAKEALTRMIERDQPFFDALRRLVDRGHALTIMLGNHDIELSLPEVRAHLLNALGQQTGRVQFIYDGEAYVVGRVLIEHGNRYDRFNVVNHDELRRLRSLQSRRQQDSSTASFTPPLGSLLVSGVMNEIKAQYPFIDLLKPETEAALPILLALAPEHKRRILFVASIWLRSLRHSSQQNGVPRLLGEISGGQDGERAIERILSERGVRSEAIDAFFDATVLVAEEESDSTGHVMGEIGSGSQQGVWAMLKLLGSGSATPMRRRLLALRQALLAAKEDYSFDSKRELDTYLEPARKLMSNGFDVVVFGHTHLAKEIEVGGGKYINTGTWCDLIEFPFESLEGDEQQAVVHLEDFVSRLQQSASSCLAEFRPTFAEIEVPLDGGRPTACLRTFSVA